MADILLDHPVVQLPVALLEDVLEENELESIQEQLLAEKGQYLQHWVLLDELFLAVVGYDADVVESVLYFLVEPFVHIVQALFIIFVHYGILLLLHLLENVSGLRF